MKRKQERIQPHSRALTPKHFRMWLRKKRRITSTCKANAIQCAMQ